MFDRVFLAICGIFGSCAAIGVPILTQESQQLKAVWGNEWAGASNATLLSGLSGPLNNTLRVSICKELGLTETTHVNSNEKLVSQGGGGWVYECYSNGGVKKELIERLESDHYEWNLRDETNSLKLRCKNIIKGDSGSVELEWSKCKKQ